MTSTEITLKKTNEKGEKVNLVLFALGKFISIFGTSIYTFAIGYHVLKVTGSGLSFAVTLALGTIPMILVNPIAGVMADRFDKKSMIVAMDLLNGILFASLYFLSSIFGLSLMMIYGSTFVMTVFTTFFSVSMESAKPNLVSEKMLMNINSLSKIIDSVSSILGPVVGGFMFVFMDIKFFIMANALSFMISGILEMFMDFKLHVENQEKDKVKASFVKDIKEGLKYMAERKELMDMLFMLVVLNFCLGFSYSVPLPFIINNILKLSPKEFGIIQGAFPVGLIMGAFVVKNVSEKISCRRLLITMSMVLSLCLVLVGLPLIRTKIEFSSVVYLSYYSITVFISGIAIAFIDIPFAYILQKTTPDEYRGRVLSIGLSIIKTILPVALILSGMLLNKVPPYLLPMAGGAALFAYSIAVFKRSSFKNET